ncbi:MAG: hypothetical protein PHF63_11965 [Herbinix sp.]|nr:hypothetical protein [Herbinix sp.]
MDRKMKLTTTFIVTALVLLICCMIFWPQMPQKVEVTEFDNFIYLTLQDDVQNDGYFFYVTSKVDGNTKKMPLSSTTSGELEFAGATKDGVMAYSYKTPAGICAVKISSYKKLTKNILLESKPVRAKVLIME